MHSGRVDGLNPRHLKDLTSFTCGEAGLKLKSSIAKLVDLIRNGKIISEILPIFYGATLLKRTKKFHQLQFEKHMETINW